MYRGGPCCVIINECASNDCSSTLCEMSPVLDMARAAVGTATMSICEACGLSPPRLQITRRSLNHKSLTVRSSLTCTAHPVSKVRMTRLKSARPPHVTSLARWKEDALTVSNSAAARTLQNSSASSD